MSNNWLCKCTAGQCHFKTKREALEASRGKFCGRKPVVKRRKESKMRKLESELHEAHKRIAEAKLNWANKQWDRAVKIIKELEKQLVRNDGR